MFLADEVYQNKYGTFLGNHERDRKNLNLANKTESIWTQVYLDKDKFTNKLFSAAHTQDPIKCVPLISPNCLPIWREYLFKWSNKSDAMISYK